MSVEERIRLLRQEIESLLLSAEEVKNARHSGFAGSAFERGDMVVREHELRDKAARKKDELEILLRQLPKQKRPLPKKQMRRRRRPI